MKYTGILEDNRPQELKDKDFDSREVIEAKNLKTGATHTKKEFARDRKLKKKK